jgi:hypothetical protein
MELQFLLCVLEWTPYPSLYRDFEVVPGVIFMDISHNQRREGTKEWHLTVGDEGRQRWFGLTPSSADLWPPAFSPPLGRWLVDPEMGTWWSTWSYVGLPLFVDPLICELHMWWSSIGWCRVSLPVGYFSLFFIHIHLHTYIHQHLLKLLVIYLTIIFEFYLLYFYTEFDSRMWHLRMVNIRPRGMSSRTRSTLWVRPTCASCMWSQLPHAWNSPNSYQSWSHTLDKNIYKQKYIKNYKSFFVKKQNLKNKLYQQKME